MINTTVKKKCSRCGDVKSLEYFSLDPRNSTLTVSQCKSCRSKNSIDYYNRNKESVQRKTSALRKINYRINRKTLQDSICMLCQKPSPPGKVFVDRLTLRTLSTVVNPSTLLRPGVVVLCKSCLRQEAKRRFENDFI